MEVFEIMCRSVSAVQLTKDHVAVLTPNESSTEEIQWIQYFTDYSDGGFGELVCRVRGSEWNLSAAEVMLANAAAVNLQLIAVYGNAAVLPYHLRCAYEPRPGGRFKVARRLGDDPHIARRSIEVEGVMKMMKLCNAHPKRDRLMRAVENYGAALRLLDPSTPVHSVVHLWIAVENLTHVAIERLKRELQVESRPKLAAALGLEPKPGATYVPDGELFGEIRRREIFAEHEGAHKALKDSSDGIEHGFKTFAEAMAGVSDALLPAAACIRKAILREAGFSPDEVEAAATGICERPLALWRPFISAAGRFSEGDAFDFDREPLHFRLDGSVRVGEFDPATHSIEAEFNSNLVAVQGPERFVTSVSIESPGKLNAFRYEIAPN